jgi:hypothetical protein
MGFRAEVGALKKKIDCKFLGLPVHSLLTILGEPSRPYYAKSTTVSINFLFCWKQ